MAVHEISWSQRLVVTARLIEQLRPKRVLELGSAEFSFRPMCTSLEAAEWITLDSQGPCDIRADINQEELQLPIQGASFDVVVCTEVIEHLLWPQSLLRELARVLNRGGHLIVSVPNMNSASYRLAWLFGRMPSCAASGNLPPVLGSTAYETDGKLFGGHVIDFNADRLEALLKFSGFRVARMVGCGLFWHRQILPSWAVPARLSSNLIAVASPG
jgi:SAM-dependent methyltransferase